jgi:hypothetical protein
MGAVSFLHRFGSSLNPHYHYHLCVVDGPFDTPRAPGFSLNASVRIEATDRAGLERLLRYCARPPFALERLHLVAGRSDQVLYLLPDPDLAGRTALRLSALEFLDRLAKILPPPRLHRHRYHGIFAPVRCISPSHLSRLRAECPREGPQIPDRSPRSTCIPPPPLRILFRDAGSGFDVSAAMDVDLRFRFLVVGRLTVRSNSSRRDLPCGGTPTRMEAYDGNDVAESFLAYSPGPFGAGHHGRGQRDVQSPQRPRRGNNLGGRGWTGMGLQRDGF